VFPAIAKDLATSHKVPLIYCVLACGIISKPFAPTSLIYKIFQSTGVGSFTICATLPDVTLANVVPAGIIPVVAHVSVASTATALDCTPLVAVTAPVSVDVHVTANVPVKVELPVTARSHATDRSSPTVKSSVIVWSSTVWFVAVRLSTFNVSISIFWLPPSHL